MVFKKGFTQDRWNKARDLRELYIKSTGDDKVGLREFYKSKNLALEQIYKYEVTFELNYSNAEKGYEFFIPQETFVFYSTNADSKEFFEEQVKGSIANVFKGGARSWVYDNLEQKHNTYVTRGIEKDNTGLDYNEVDAKRLLNNNSYIKDFKSISVNKKKKAGTNKNNYDLIIFDSDI